MHDNAPIDPTAHDALAIAPAAPEKGGDVVRILLTAAFILVGVLLLRNTPWGQQIIHSDASLFRRWLAPWGAWAWAGFILIGTGLLSLGFPRLAFSAVAGAIFGVFYGAILAEIATTLSAIPAFYYTYFVGRDMIIRRLGGRRLQKFNALLERHGFMVMLLIRLIPVGNSFVTNCLAGLSAIRFSSYITASAIGFLPLTFICAYLGGGLVSHSKFPIFCSVGLFAAFSIVFMWYFRHSPLAREITAIMRDEDSQEA